MGDQRLMQFLLDTNAVLWHFWGATRMEPVLRLIGAGDAQVFISAVSWWELAIKIRIGKLPVDLKELRRHAGGYNFFELPLTGRYTDTLVELPKIHNDPFDHMLLAQAIAAPMRFITGDAVLAEYSSLVMVI
jgi:PIN domain nuclease of toxin-antitoxin system